MNRKDEIAFDLMTILKKVYSINSLSKASEKQEELIQAMVDYLDENISLRKKRKEKEKDETEKVT